MGHFDGNVVMVTGGTGNLGKPTAEAFAAAGANVVVLDRNAMPKADHSKWVKPASLAEVILFLASDAARDIHGAAIPVQGLS